MRKIRFKKDSVGNINVVTSANKTATEENIKSESNEMVDDFLEEVDRVDEEYSILGEKKENFRNVRKCLVATDKIIDKEL